MKPAQRPWPSPLLRSNTGFTLVELAVGTAISALLIIITTGVLSPQLRMNQLLGGRMRLEERWSRVNVILNRDIQEAHIVQRIGNGLELLICEPIEHASNNQCKAVANSDIKIGYDVAICYELVPDPASDSFQLERRGPMIESNGALRTQGATRSCADFMAEVVTTGVTTFSAQEPTTHTVTYAISLRDPFDPNGSSYTKESTAAPRPSKY